MAAPILRTKTAVEFSYPKDDDHTYRIPPGVELVAGRSYCIFGVSGSGKSTLLTLLASLRTYNRGEIDYVFDDSRSFTVTASNWRQQAGPRLWANIGFAFQRPELIKTLTVEQNLELTRSASRDDVEQLFNIEKEWAEIRGSRIWKVSGGQTQRLGLLRAFGRGQRLVFLDEPTNNLDRDNRDAAAHFVHSQQNDRAIVVVSHDQEFLRLIDVDTTFRIEERVDANGHKTRILSTTA